MNTEARPGPEISQTGASDRNVTVIGGPGCPTFGVHFRVKRIYK